MKKFTIIFILAVFILSSCTGNKYSKIAIKIDEQEIKVDITDIAHKNAEERMKEKGNDNLLVMIKGSC